MTIIVNDYLCLPTNWGTALSYKRIWRTSIQTSVEAKEKRSALFTWPRRSLQFEILTMTSLETQFLFRKLYKNLHNTWGIPFWAEEQLLTSNANSGQAVIDVESTLKSDFEVGGEVAIIDQYNHYEVGTILSMTATSITLTENLIATWESGLYVYPILKGKMQINPSVSNPVDGHSQFQIEIIEHPDTSITHVPFTTASFPTYQSLPLFNIRPNWINNLDFEYGHNYAELKFLGLGTEAYSLVDESTIKLSANYSAFDNTELYEILSFFDDQKGRFSSFWISTDNPDVNVTAAQDWDDPVLSISDIEWTFYFSGNTIVGNYVEFFFPDGYTVRRKIIAATSTTMTLDAAIGATITSALLPFLKVSFLLLVRFDIDELEITKTTDAISEFSLKVSTLNDDISYVASTAPTVDYYA